MRFFFFGVCILICGSCFDRGDCLIISTNQVAFELYSLKKRDSAISLQFDRILIPGQANFNVQAKLSQFRLPLNPNTSQTTFVFEYKGVRDTLVLSYSKQTKVLSSECGSFQYFQDLNVEYTTFDMLEMSLTDPKILTTVAPNIEIHY